MGFLRTLLRFLGVAPIPFETSQAIATMVLGAVKARDATVIRQCSWWPVRLLVSTKRLTKLWSTLDSSLGPVEDFSRPEIHEDGLLGTRTVKSLVRFQRGRLGVSIKFWGDKLIGLNVHAPISIGLTPKWEVPEYADEKMFSEEDVSVRPYWVWPSVKGTLNMPRRKGRKPAVLMAPGSGVGDRDISVGAVKPWKDLAYALASAGCVVLRLDKPIPVLLFKQLVTKTLTMHDEYIPHHVAGLQYLASHPEVHPKKIFVLGGSLGGRLAPRICASSPVPLAGMISVAGASRPLVDELLDQFGYLQHHFPKARDLYEREMAAVNEVKALIEQGKGFSKGKSPPKDFIIPITMSYFVDDYENNPIQVARGLAIPMFFMQGRKDWQVPPSDLNRWEEGLKGSPAGERATFRLYDDVGHLFIPFKNEEKGAFQYDEPGHVSETVTRDIARWIEQVVE